MEQHRQRLRPDRRRGLGEDHGVGADDGHDGYDPQQVDLSQVLTAETGPGVGRHLPRGPMPNDGPSRGFRQRWHRLRLVECRK
jgi:hypothetical protein